MQNRPLVTNNFGRHPIADSRPSSLTFNISNTAQFPRSFRPELMYGRSTAAPQLAQT